MCLMSATKARRKARILGWFECIILELLVTASILVITRRMLHPYNLKLL